MLRVDRRCCKNFLLFPRISTPAYPLGLFYSWKYEDDPYVKNQILLLRAQGDPFRCTSLVHRTSKEWRRHTQLQGLLPLQCTEPSKLVPDKWILYTVWAILWYNFFAKIVCHQKQDWRRSSLVLQPVFLHYSVENKYAGGVLVHHVVRGGWARQDDAWLKELLWPWSRLPFPFLPPPPSLLPYWLDATRTLK